MPKGDKAKKGADSHDATAVNEEVMTSAQRDAEKKKQERVAEIMTGKISLVPLKKEDFGSLGGKKKDKAQPVAKQSTKKKKGKIALDGWFEGGQQKQPTMMSWEDALDENRLAAAEKAAEEVAERKATSDRIAQSEAAARAKEEEKRKAAEKSQRAAPDAKAPSAASSPSAKGSKNFPGSTAWNKSTPPPAPAPVPPPKPVVKPPPVKQPPSTAAKPAPKTAEWPSLLVKGEGGQPGSLVEGSQPTEQIAAPPSETKATIESNMSLDAQPMQTEFSFSINSYAGPSPTKPPQSPFAPQSPTSSEPAPPSPAAPPQAQAPPTMAKPPTPVLMVPSPTHPQKPGPEQLVDTPAPAPVAVEARPPQSTGQSASTLSRLAQAQGGLKLSLPGATNAQQVPHPSDLDQRAPGQGLSPTVVAPAEGGNPQGKPNAINPAAPQQFRPPPPPEQHDFNPETDRLPVPPMSVSLREVSNMGGSAYQPHQLAFMLHNYTSTQWSDLLKKPPPVTLQKMEIPQDDPDRERLECFNNLDASNLRELYEMANTRNEMMTARVELKRMEMQLQQTEIQLQLRLQERRQRLLDKLNAFVECASENRTLLEPAEFAEGIRNAFIVQNQVMIWENENIRKHPPV